MIVWKNIFTTYRIGKGLLSIVHKETPQTNREKGENNPIENEEYVQAIPR